MKRKQRKQEKIFDNAFRSLEEHCPELFVPLINEIFGKNYSESAIVVRRADVHVKDKRIDTDGCLEIGGIKYHLECQSKPDGTIAIRMFEYDVAIALEHKHKEQGRYVVDFPCSCVIYLRQGGKRKKEEIVSVRFSDGKKIDYKVPVRNIHSYSKEELFEKSCMCFFRFI